MIQLTVLTYLTVIILVCGCKLINAGGDFDANGKEYFLSSNVNWLSATIDCRSKGIPKSKLYLLEKHGQILGGNMLLLTTQAELDEIIEEGDTDGYWVGLIVSHNRGGMTANGLPVSTTGQY